MEPLDIAQTDELDNSLPETPHVEIMFDALNDTVTGTEGMALTEAQVYANGVLGANSNRSGNEGFFSSITTGAKSVYDYIVKMFKSVWGFFFNRDAKTEVAEAKKEVADLQTELKDAGKSSNMAEAKKKLDAMHKAYTPESAEQKAENDPIRKALADRIAEVKAKDDLAAANKVIAEVVAEAPNLKKKVQYDYAQAVEKSNKLANGFAAYISKQLEGQGKVPVPVEGSATEKLAKKLLDVIGKYRTHTQDTAKHLEGHKEVKSLSDGNSLHQIVQSEIQSADTFTKAMAGLTSEINAEINALEAAVKENKLDEKEKAQIGGLRSCLTVGAGAASYVKKSLKAQIALSKTINSVFGLGH